VCSATFDLADLYADTLTAFYFLAFYFFALIFVVLYIRVQMQLVCMRNSYASTPEVETTHAMYTAYSAVKFHEILLA